MIGESLTPLVAMRYACAFAEGLPPGPIIITRDGRASGRMLAKAISAALEAIGRRTINAGVAATPTTGVLVRTLPAAGGLQISASHNPAEYNGLKLFSAAGQVISADAGEEVIRRYRTGEPAWATHDELGASRRGRDTIREHLALILDAVDAPRIRSRGYRVVLDANHGAGGELGAALLEALGCQVAVLGEEADGHFEHEPEPTAENLRHVAPRVSEAGAAIGFCQDPDADRLAIIDERGRYLGEEYTLALCVDHVLRKTPGAIVTNCSTSRMSEDLAEKYGVPFGRSKVGEANVVECMKACQASLGGEGNGGVIDPRVGFVRDSFIGMALLLEAMATRQAPISRLAHELPAYAMVKTKISFPAEKFSEGLAALKNRFADAQCDELDGLRLDWPDKKWLLVRPSNTEPIVRAIAEASTEQEARRLCDLAAQTLAGAVGDV